MPESVLVTGGAGFIGRYVTDALLERGDDVRVLDSFVEQVHGSDQTGSQLNPNVEVIQGDVLDPDAVRRALVGVDAVVHLAAEVGVGQSMYEVERYVGANDLGTAVLFEALIGRPVRRVVVASSMSIYGEGLYQDSSGALVENAERDTVQGRRFWDPIATDGQPLTPLPTPEAKRPSLSSVYALTKYAQERLTLMLTAAYGMEGVALRLFNVYGPGQALSNPYTGVLAIFASRLMHRQRPLVFEDGLQRRDFVHVEDVARAFVLALEEDGVDGQALNIGSGQSINVLEVAHELAIAMNREEITPDVTGKARAGDIRHCFADIALARKVLGFSPRRQFDEGVAELAEWVARQQSVDRVSAARAELEERGLVV